MAVNLCKWVLSDLVNLKTRCFVRYGHRMRGKPPTVARNIQQRLEELERKDEIYCVRVDIGLPEKRMRHSLKDRLEHVRKLKSDDNMERLSRTHKLNIDLDEVKNEWFYNKGPQHIKKIAEHYGIFEHLYTEGYFYPRVKLNIAYPFGDNLCPVYYGNVIKPLEAQSIPEVNFVSDKDSIWTVTLISLDGNFTDSNKEYIHWCVTNIPGNDINKGNTIVEYLQPIPPKGIGFQRYVFVLYKQNKIMEFDIEKVKSLDPLMKRAFVTREWYKKYQDDITPAGLAFFQSDWDTSLKDFFHHKLQMKEPIFEYDFPKPYIKPQEWFPLRESFNLYMDRYRDPKQINKEYLMLKMKKEHPFRRPEPPLRFPNAQRYPDDMPSWQRLEERKNRLGVGRINQVA